MPKRLAITLLVVVLVLGVFQVGAFARDREESRFDHFQSRLGFDDLDEAPWAAQYFAELSLKGLFQGRGNGKMAPQSSVSRLEVLALVIRALGVEDQAQALGETLTPADFAYTDSATYSGGNVAWGLGYLKLADQLGLIEEGAYNFQPSAAAKRAWVAEVLVKAVALESEAQAEMDVNLNAPDAGDVAPDQVGFLSVAMEFGLLTGYPDGSLKPNKPVTRAEMAALLDRSDEQLEAEGENVTTNDTGDEGNDEHHRDHPGKADAVVKGTVTALSDTSITVLPDMTKDDRDEEEDHEGDSEDEGDENGSDVTTTVAAEEVTYPYADGVFLFMKGQLVGEGGADVAANLLVGDHATLFLNEDDAGDLQATFIIGSWEKVEVKAEVLEVTEPDSDGTVTATLQLVADDEQGDDEQGEDEGEEGDDESSEVNNAADTTWYGDACTEPDADGTFTCDVDESVYVKLRGKAAAPGDLAVGDTLELKFHQASLIEVVVDERAEADEEEEHDSEATEVEGTVVSYTDDVLTVDVDGTSMEFAVNDDTEIELGDEVEALEAGQSVEVKYVVDDSGTTEVLTALKVEVDSED